MRKYLTVSFLLAVFLSLQFFPSGEYVKAQTLVDVKWALYEVQLNPLNVLTDYTYERRVTVSGNEQGANGFITTSVTTGALSYEEWVEDLQGNVLWSQRYSYDYAPPPSEFTTGDRFEITVNGNAVCNKPAEGVSGPANFISGVRVNKGLADSQGNFLNRPNDTYLEVGDRKSYSESVNAPFRAVAAKIQIPLSEQFYRIDVTSTAEFKTEQGDKGPLVVAWIYQAVEIDEDTPAETSQPAVTTTNEPKDKNGEDALDILGRIGREVARERIQNEVKASLEGLGELLTDQWDSFTGWTEGLLDDTIAWMEGPLVDKFGDDFGAGEPESPGLSWEEVNDQLGERIKPVAGVNEESMDELFDKVKNILWEEDPETGRYIPRRTTTFDTVDVKLNDGGSVNIGILVTPEGRIMYTPNGKDYFPKLQTAVDPSWYEQAIDLYTGTKNWIWESLFTGSTRNPDIDLQNKVASEVLEDLRIQLDAGETPQTMVDWTEGKLWSNQIQGPIQTKTRQILWQQAEEILKNHITGDGKIPSAEDLEKLALFEDMKFQFQGGEMTTPKAWAEYKSQTGIDLFELTEAGSYAVAGGEFAVESVKTMARGLQDTDFAVRTRAYIEERKAGYTIDLIYENMRNGNLPELDIGAAKAASGGTSSMMASSGIAAEAQMGIVFTMYEKAYQRYLLAQQMGRKP